MWNPGQPAGMPPSPFGAAMSGGYGASSWNNAPQAPMENQWTNYYQTMPASQVDWASLAQQWIAMKGTQHPSAPSTSFAPPPPVIQSPSTPVPPPPPPISYHFQGEGGVANMDLEEDDEIDHEEKVDHHHHSSQIEEVPTKYHHHTSKRSTSIHSYASNHKRKFYNQSNWNSVEKTALINEAPNASGGGGLDAAARKKLPAWIREGLEKMEKEKLKKEQAEFKAKAREEIFWRIDSSAKES